MAAFQAFTTELKEGKIDEYLKYHDEIWPDVAAGLRAAGVTCVIAASRSRLQARLLSLSRQLTIFRVPDTRRLFMYITTAGDTVMGVAPPASARSRRARRVFNCRRRRGPGAATARTRSAESGRR